MYNIPKIRYKPINIYNYPQVDGNQVCLGICGGVGAGCATIMILTDACPLMVILTGMLLIVGVIFIDMVN